MASRSNLFRRMVLRLSVAWLLAAAVARTASAQVINEPPALPVSISMLPTADAIEASGFNDLNSYDILLIRNGVTISTILGATSVGGVLNVNGAVPGVCWAGVTPDMRPGDIVQYVVHQPDGTVSSIEQTRAMRITEQKPVVVQNDDPATPGGEGIVEVHGTAADLTGLPIPVANVEQRFINGARFAFNGKRTLRAGGANTDGSFVYDLTNNPTGTNWTVRYSGLVGGDINLILNAQSRATWLGAIPANVNQFSIYENDATVVAGPLAGTCTTPFEALDVAAPTAPTTLASTVTGPDSRKFTWGASTDNVEVAGYELRRDGAVVGATGPLVTTFTDTGIPAGSHAYTVVAFDNASALGAGATPPARILAGLGQPWGNRSAASNTLNIVQADVIAPTTPASLAVPTGNGKALPSWAAATDNVGVVAYGVYRNNVLIATVPSPTTAYKDSGLVTGSYNYSVDAVDAANLRSPRTANVAASVVFIPDTTPPTVPGGMSASVSPDVHGRVAVLNWNAATDSMGVTGYRLMRNGVQRALLGASTLSFRDSALATATYNYTVDAFDAANNHSAASAVGVAVIANDPPLAPHVLVAHPSRDEISATGYPAAQGPYVFDVFRGATQFTSTSAAVSANGLVQVNAAGGACWLGTTPDLRAGDVVRITNAAGIAEQTTIADLSTQFAIPASASSIVVHGTARDAAGNPLPPSQLEHRLVAASGVFDKNATATLRAISVAGADGSIAYDAPGSIHWTATYSGLSAADVARASGGPANAPAESRALWLGRTPAAGTEQSLFETGPAVNGGPAAGTCVTPAEAPVAAAAFVPAAQGFGSVAAIPPATGGAQTIEIDNTGGAPMAIRAVYIAGLHAGDFSITSPPAPASLAPGGFFTVDVTFSPKALGARQATLCLSCDAAGTTALSIPLTGTGITDITPPTIPTGVSASVGPDVHGHDATVSWSAATDSVGVTGYTVYRDGAAVATTNPSTLTYHDAGLAAAPHAYRIDAFDLQNNHSQPSAAVSVTVASEPPAAGHVLIAHPTRDAVSASGYAAANGPFVVNVYRGNKLFTASPLNADANGLVQVNGAAGGCWNGTTPELRAGDVVRITDANGFADQTVVADVSADLATAIDSATVVVHGTAQDANGAPLPLAQLEHRLVLAAGMFDQDSLSVLRAGAAAGDAGTIAYDGAGSTHWTATYPNLSPFDVARATGGMNTCAGSLMPAESQILWLGHAPLAGTERTQSETGPAVMGGPSAQCAAPVESPAAIAALLPAALQFDRQGVSPASASAPQAILFRNSGDSPMRIRDVRITGLNAGDFTVVASDAPSVLAPHTFCTVSVAFSPSAIGMRQAALSLSCDAANTPGLSATLVGTGWSGLVIADPGAPAQGVVAGTAISALPDSGSGLRTIPMYVSWQPSRSPAVTRYDLQQSINGGPFVDAAVQPGSDLGVWLQLPLAPAGVSASVRFRVRAAGGSELSGWVTGNEFALESVDDMNAARVLFTGAWARPALPGAWAGGVHTTFGKVGVELKPAAPFSDLGSIAWITSMGPDRGLVSIKVDNRDSVLVDLYSDTLRTAVVGYVATNLTAGRTHRLVVHALAQPGALSVGGRVDADAFIVVNGVTHTAPVVVGHGGDALTTQLPEPPAALSFSRISPNPIRNRATLTFALPRDGAVRLDVMDVQGRLLSTLNDGVLPAGEHRITWDGRTAGASAAHSGVYFAVLRFGGETLVRRMIWMP